jgi:hypothetical protein
MQQFSTVSSNCGGRWNSKSNSFLLEEIPKSSSLVLTTEIIEEIENCSIVSHNVLFTTIFPRFKENSESNSDFIFLFDRSDLMSGSRMRRVQEYLQFFLRYIPACCSFDIFILAQPSIHILCNLLNIMMLI